MGALLTGPSAAGSVGRGWVKGNVATVGTESGVGFGTPGAGVTWGFGPFESSKDYSQPWTKNLIEDSVDGAGLPSRRNVWEYGYPEPRDEKNAETGAVPQENVRRLTRMNASNAGNVVASGSLPVLDQSPSEFDDRFGNWSMPPVDRQSSRASRPVGAFAGEPSYSISQSVRRFEDRGDTKGGPSGTAGLLGLIQDYMRNNAY